MKINLNYLEEQFAVISSCGKAIEDLEGELVSLGVNEKSSIPYIVQVLTERFQDARRKAEAELEELMRCDVDEEGFVEIKVLR